MHDSNQNSSHSVSLWLHAAKQGSESAAQMLFERYFQKLVNVSLSRVQRKKRVEDEEDAAIQAMYSFLTGIEAGKYPEINDRTALWPLLVDIVVKNSQKQRRKQYAAKRNDIDVGGESVFINASDGTLQIADFAVDQISESDSVELAEIIQKVRGGLNDFERQIFDMKLEHRSNREIAIQLGRPSRTIDRMVANAIKPQLQSLLAM
jgi:RNA polymerase sigma factor (sigma-70 family)